MARPLRPAEILGTFRKWGVPFNEVDGWETRSNRSGWGEPRVTGCMDHHTANDASDRVNRALIRDGHATLNGPLANFGVTDTGVIDIIAAGSANHAGGGDPDTYAAVQSEKYTGNLQPNENSSSTGAVNGNPRFYGWESYYGAGDDKFMEALQYRVMVLSNAAIVDMLDIVDTANRWTSKSVIGHKEWTNRKIDPLNVVMSDLRDDVQWCLDKGPELARHWYLTGKRELPVITPPPPKPVPPQTIPQESDMALFLIQQKGLAPVYKSDGFRRVHVDRTERDALLQVGVRLHVFDTAEEVAAFGDTDA